MDRCPLRVGIHNCRASSSPHKSRFAGTPMFIDVIYSKQTASESGGFSEGDEDGFVDLSVRLYEDAAEEHHKTAQGEHGSG